MKDKIFERKTKSFDERQNLSNIFQREMKSLHLALALHFRKWLVYSLSEARFKAKPLKLCNSYHYFLLKDRFNIVMEEITE